MPQTPGPWHVQPDEEGGAFLCADEESIPNAITVAYVEHVADAYVLAAAPELCAFVRACVTVLHAQRLASPDSTTLPEDLRTLYEDGQHLITQMTQGEEA